MAVKIRLKRLGTTKRPFWRIVVSDGRMPRDGRFIEEVGVYDPKKNPAHVEFKQERIKHWLSVGACPTEIVRSLLRSKGISKTSKS